MNNFWTRTLTGAVFVAVMIAGIVWNLWSFIALCSLIALSGAWEFYSLMKVNAATKTTGLLLGLLLLMAASGMYFYPVADVSIPPILLIPFLLFPLYLIIKLFGPLQ